MKISSNKDVLSTNVKWDIVSIPYVPIQFHTCSPNSNLVMSILKQPGKSDFNLKIIVYESSIMIL